MGELIATGRGEFFVERSGPPDGPTVVLVAGLGDDHASWGDVLGGLGRHFDCVAFDNRGIGRSPISPGPYSIAGMAADAEAVAQALGLGSVAAIGSSMGGFICQEWELARPDRISRLILTNTAGRVDVWVQALVGHWIELAAAGRGRDLLHQLAVMCFSPAFLEQYPHAIEEFLETAPVPDLAGFAAAAAGCRDHDALGRLGAITSPTLVIGAEHDIILRPELSTELAKAIPGAELQWLRAGHMPFLEQPDQWLTAVGAFLGART